jgi:hypothetical protein
MRTFTSGKGKVHHVPARQEASFELTHFLCGRFSENGVEHTNGAVNCQGCLGKLRAEEFDAYWEAQRRKQRAEDAAAYELIKQREAKEKAAREAARVTPTVHVVALKALPSYGEDNWTSDASGTGEPRLVYRMHSRYGRGNVRFTIFYVGPDGEARRVHGGPVLSGPYCALIPMSSVISAHAGPREEAVEVKEGDVLLLNGAPMILIDDQALEYPHAVTPAEYGARLAAREIKKLRAENMTASGPLAWDAALQEAQTRVTSLYRNGHTVLPFTFEAPAVEPIVEHVLHLNNGDQLRVLGSETIAGEPGGWAERLHPSGEVAELDWWPLKYLVSDEASAYERFRPHIVERTDGRTYLVLGSETKATTGLRGVWLNPIDDDHPRWVAEDILLRNFRAPSS